MIQNPIPAATCVVVREAVSGGGPEILLVRRTDRASFMAGAHVFPGGRVDAADAAADPSWCDGLAEARSHWPGLDSGEAIACHVAAARELFEEAGLLLARDRSGRLVADGDEAMAARRAEWRAAVHGGRAQLRDLIGEAGLRLALDLLLPLGHWVTPSFETKRFEARFFVAAVPPGQVARHDASETTQGIWMTARQALERCRLGEIALFPPTWGSLADLARFDSVETILASTRTRPVFRREPALVEVDGVRLLVLPGDPLYPAPEAEHVTLVHPETRFVFQAGRWVATIP